MLTRTQDDALVLLADLVTRSRGPINDAAMLLIDAVRRGDADEQRDCMADLRKLIGERAR